MTSSGDYRWLLQSCAAGLGVAAVVLWFRSSDSRETPRPGSRGGSDAPAGAPYASAPPGAQASTAAVADEPARGDPDPTVTQSPPSVDPDLLASIRKLAMDYERKNQPYPNPFGGSYPAPSAIYAYTPAGMRELADSIIAAGQTGDLNSILSNAQLPVAIRGMAADLLRLTRAEGWEGTLLASVHGESDPTLRMRLIAVLVCGDTVVPSGRTREDYEDLGPNIDEARKHPHDLLPRERPVRFGGGRYPDGSASSETIDALLGILNDASESEEIRLLVLEALQWSCRRELGRGDPILTELRRSLDDARDRPADFSPELLIRLEARFRTHADEFERRGEGLPAAVWLDRALRHPDAEVRRTLMVNFLNRGGGYSLVDEADQVAYGRAFAVALVDERDPALRIDYYRVIHGLSATAKDSAGLLPHFLEIRVVTFLRRRPMLLDSGPDGR